MNKILIMMLALLQRIDVKPQVVVDFTNLNTKQSSIGVPGNVMDGSIRRISSLLDNFSLTECSVQGNTVALVIDITNTSHESQEIPLSLDQAKVHSPGNLQRKTLSLSIHEEQTSLPAKSEGGAVLFAAASQSSSFYRLDPGRTMTLKLVLGPGEFMWREGKRMTLSAQEYSVVDENYMTSRTSTVVPAKNSFAIHSGKCDIYPAS